MAEDRQRVTLTITSEALEVLESHSTERKRGEFVSQLLASYGRGAGTVPSGLELEALRLQVLGLLAQGKSADARLVKVEQTLAAVIANKSR